VSNGTDPTYERIDTNYEFFPSVRQGYRPTRTYTGGTLTGRTTMGVDLTVEGRNADSGEMEAADDQPHVDLRMYGPGDVTGIDEREVVRVEPEPETDTFPPNYLPLVEFDRADMPWLFSPERANDGGAGKVRPWMCLVVVERDHDDVSIEAKGDRPLPALSTPATQLPPIEEVWAWAHVQVVGLLSTPELDRVFTESTHQAVSRLLCPRNLDPNTPYVAAVVPTFEPGRKIGLGEEPFGDSDPPEVAPAWETDADETVTLPVYHHWEFVTGDRGDFESMVRNLEPRNLATDYEIGVREVDMSDPGPIPLEAPDGITRKLGGALRSPTVDPSPYPTVANDGSDDGKREVLRDILNDPATAVTEDDSEMPVLGPPIYGQWYVPPSEASPAATSPLPPEVPQPASVPTEGSSYFDSWFHDLNVNPQHRIPAGYGTSVIQENQETLMREAWQRFGDLEEANADMGNRQAGDLIGGNILDQFETIDEGVVGFASRVRGIESLRRRIDIAGRLPDEGFFEDEAFVESFGDGTAGGGLAGGYGDGTAGGYEGGLAGGYDDTVGGGRTRFVEGIEGTETIRSNVAAAAGDGDAAGGRSLQPDGGGGLALDTSDAARFASLTSATFRRVSRPGGKLNRAIGGTDGSPFLERARTTTDAPGASGLRGRFGKSKGDGDTGEGTPPIQVPDLGSPAGEGAPPEEGGETPESERAGEATADTAGETTADTAETDWRVTEGGRVMSLAEAVEYHDDEVAAVPKALLQVESVADHCETARDRLADLRDRLGADAPDDRATGLRSLVEERPTVLDHAEAIRRNTFDTTDRQLRKLVAADPEALDAEFTAEKREAVMADAVEAHERLMGAVTEVVEAIRSGEFDADRLRDRVDAAVAAVDDVERATGRVRDRIDPGTAFEGPATAQAMQFTSGALRGDAPGAGSEALRVGGDPERAEFEAATGRTLRRIGAGTSFDPELQLRNVRTDLLEGRNELPGVLDAGGWAVERAGWEIHPGIGDRENPLDRIMAAPEFEWPMYEYLRDLDQEYLMPGVEEIPRETIGALATNPEFIEAFMCGLNHEFGRELLWRRYPTDRRGTYFRQFWDYIGDAEQKDIKEMHEWLTGELGENAPDDEEGDRVVLIVRGDLLKSYPDTRVYAAKAVKEDKSDPDTAETDWDRVPLVEHRRQEALEERRKKSDPEKYDVLPRYDETQLEEWEPREPIFRGKLDPDVTFFGFEITSEEAVGDSTTEAEGERQGWFFVLEEPVGETRFGFDVPSAGDYGSRPYGVRDGNGNVRKMDGEAYNEGAEKGWDGLSWGHLVGDESKLEAKEHVRVGEDRPAGGGQPWAVKEGTEWTGSSVDVDETWNVEDESEWGRNSAHMAHITWQLPVRVCIHADDILPGVSGDGGDGGSSLTMPATWESDVVSNGGDGA